MLPELSKAYVDIRKYAAGEILLIHRNKFFFDCGHGIHVGILVEFHVFKVVQEARLLHRFQDRFRYVLFGHVCCRYAAGHLFTVLVFVTEILEYLQNLAEKLIKPG